MTTREADLIPDDADSDPGERVMNDYDPEPNYRNAESLNSNNDKSYCTDHNLKYDYDLSSAPLNKKLLILTRGGISMTGHFTGDKDRDADIIGWFKLPTRDKALEEKLGICTPTRKKPNTM